MTTDYDKVTKQTEVAVDIGVMAGAMLESKVIEVEDSRSLTYDILMWASDFETWYHASVQIVPNLDYLACVESFARARLLDVYGVIK